MGKVDCAVILAAGLGSRIASFSKDLPKGFIPIDGTPIIERSIDNLLSTGIRQIVIGTGYKSEAYESLASKYPLIECKRNDQYATTGSMYTLHNLRELVKGDFLLLESDLLYDKAGLEAILTNSKENVILASGPTGSRDEVFIEVDDNFKLKGMSKDKTILGSVYGELTGISKISQTAFAAMNDYARNSFIEIPGLDYEYALVGIRGQENIYVHKIDDYIWCEIDDEQHLARAEKMIYPKIMSGKE